MEAPKQKLAQLLAKPSLSREESDWLFAYLQDTDAPELQQLMRQQFGEESPLPKELSEKLLSQIHAQMLPVEERARLMSSQDWETEAAVGGQGRKTGTLVRMRGWKKAAAAAAVLFMLAGATYLFIHTSTTPATIAKSKTPLRDIPAPTSNKATITLGNGQQIILDSTENGTLAQEGNVTVVKNPNGEIAYTSDKETSGNKSRINTLTNPRGSNVVTLVLADGTRVWLNAESSITYPTAFADNERKVTITGEAYFEVVHNTAKPFFVKKGDAEVQVLGTHFNVNAYDDENDLKVTLLEGSVKVSDIMRSESRIIKPGEQAQVSSTIKVVKDADPESVMAWKNGYFSFHNADLQTIMKQLARWYDIKVRYENGINAQRFTGDIGRTLTLKQVLEGLKIVKANYTIDVGNTVIVRP